MEEIKNILKIYVDCSGEEVLMVAHKRCTEIRAVEDNYDKSQQIVKDLEDIHFIVRNFIMDKLLNYLHLPLNSK